MFLTILKKQKYTHQTTSSAFFDKIFSLFPSTNTNNNNNHVTGLKTPDKNGSAVAVDGFPDHRPQAPSEVIKVTPSDTVPPPVVMGGKSGHGDGHHPPASGHRFEPGRKRCSISVHSQHNQHLPGGDGGGPGGGSNGDAIRPGGYRELSPQSLRIHRKSSHDIRILGADGETLHGFMEGGKMPNVVKPMKLKCISTKAESYDTLHGRALDVSTVGYIFAGWALGNVRVLHVD